MKNKIINLSWETVEKYAQKVFLEVEKRNFKPEVIVPILRGGLPLSVILSRLFKVRDFEVIQIEKSDSDETNARFNQAQITCTSSMEKIRNKNVLVVEDIVASKDTLKTALKKLKSYRPKAILTTTLVSFNKNDINIVSGKDYVKDQYWIVFPWECLETKNGKQ